MVAGGRSNLDWYVAALSSRTLNSETCGIVRAVIASNEATELTPPPKQPRWVSSASCTRDEVLACDLILSVR